MSTGFSRVWANGKVVAEGFALADLDGHLADPANLVWFDLCDPTQEVVERLAGELAFDARVVEDALAPAERPKATRHDRHLFIRAYTATLTDEPGFGSRLDAHCISVFVVANGLITVRTGSGVDVPALIQRWDSDPELTAFGIGGLLHELLDMIVDTKDEVISRLDDDVEDLEGLLFDDRPQTAEVSQRAYRLRREVVEIRRLALPMRDVLNTVIRHGRDAGWDERLRSYYEDLYDHVQREAEWTESLRELVASIFETNLSLNDMRLNVVMKKLSGWAAIIAVPTLITGWFGMNVPYLGFSTQLGLWLASTIMVVSVAVLFFAFRHHDWI